MLETHGVSRRLASFNDIVPGYIFTGVYFTEKYTTVHPDRVRAFLRGLVQSFDFIVANENKARTYLPKYTGVSQDVAMRSALRDLKAKGRENFDRLHKQQDLLLKFGFLEKRASLEGIVDYSYLPR